MPIRRSVQTPVPAPAPAWTPPPAWGGPTVPSPSAPKEVDLAALASIKIAAIVAIVGTALGYVYLIVESVWWGYSFGLPSAGSTTTFPASTVWAVFGTDAVNLLIAAVSFGFLRAGFARLRGSDMRFASAPAFAVVAIVGFLLLAGGLLALASAVVATFRCAGGVTPIPSNCVSLGSLLGGVGLLGLGAVVLLIGAIGTLIGVWRLGDRYDDGLFKAGAILLVFVGIVGAILLLIGVTRAEGRVRSLPVGSVPLPPSGSPFPPPPPRW